MAVAFSAVPLVVVAACYGSSADAVAAITVWPAWVWMVLCLPATVVAWWGLRKRALVLAAAWLVFVGVFAEEPWSLLRSVWAGGALESTAVRVFSLNCAGGTNEAVQEALAHGPELLLLQESPGRPDLDKLALGEWEVVSGPDASILALGKLEELVLPPGTSNFVAARWTRRSGGEPLYVVSLRLAPPIFRLDYWNPELWRAFAQNKRLRREELATVVAFLDTIPPESVVIVGGDFNTPPDRSIQASLRRGFRDAFSESGVGWGATAVNQTPLVRIDQIWHRGGEALATRARKTVHSDHRMVEATILIP